MVLTKAQKQDVVKHLLEEIFEQDPDSELHKTLAYNKITSPIDLINQTDNWTDKLPFLEDLKDRKPVLSSLRVMLDSSSPSKRS